MYYEFMSSCMIQVLKNKKTCLWMAAVCLICLLIVSLTACSNPAKSGTSSLPIPKLPVNPVFPPIPVVSGWPITIANESTYGTVIANRDLANPGDPVLLAIMPSGGYRLGSLSIFSGYSPVEYTILSSDTCAFIMPNGAVKISVSFATMGLPLHNITVSSTTNGVIVADPAEIQRETATVTLSAQAASGYKINPANISVTSGGQSVPVVQNDEATFSFTMPDGDVTVNGSFVSSGTALQTITVTPADNGTIGVPLAAQTGDTVGLALFPNRDYRYKEGSLTVSGGASPIEQSAPGDAIRRWSFTMPGQAVTVSAQFEEIPAHAVTVTVKGQPDHGAFTVLPYVDGKNAVQSGKKAILILNIPNRFEYRYKANSFAITGGAVSDLQEALPGRIWTFTMPNQAVSAEAEVEVTPVAKVTAGTSDYGTVIISGLKPDGSAPQGATITIQGLPNLGYQINGVPTTNPSVPLNPDGPNKWSFTMGTTPLTVNMNFSALGPLVLYKGGLNPTVSATYFAEGAGYWGGNRILLENIEINAVTEGRNGNTRAMQIYRSPTGPGSGNGQIGLAFTAASPFDLVSNNVKALSFWIKDTQSAAARFEVWGVGDVDQRKIVQNRTNNGSATEAGVWKQFIVPIPVNKAGTVSRLFFIKFDLDPGDALLMDDIEFITDYIAPQIQIQDVGTETEHKFADPFDIWDYLPNRVTLQYVGDENHADSKIVDGTSAALGDFSTRLVDWFDFGVTLVTANGASYDADTHRITPPAARNTNFTLRVTLGASQSSILTFKVPQNLQKNIEDFQKPLSGAAPGSNCWSAISGNHRWANLVDNVAETFDPGRLGAMISCTETNNGAQVIAERHFSSAINLTGFNTIEFQARYRSGWDPGTITFSVRDGTNNWFQEIFTIPEVGKKLPIRMAIPGGFNGNLTGVRFMITQGEIVISDMFAVEAN